MFTSRLECYINYTSVVNVILKEKKTKIVSRHFFLLTFAVVVIINSNFSSCKRKQTILNLIFERKKLRSQTV